MATQKRTFSLPEDIAAHLDSQPRGRASGYVADAVRQRMRLEALDVEMATVGMTVSADGPARDRARRLKVETAFPRERRDAIRDRARSSAADVLGHPQAPAA